MVYDFDFEAHPRERKYSGGRPQRDSPNKDRPREITPLREMTMKLPPIVTVPGDTTATDHTSDNDSSFTTTEDDTTTDDQMMSVVNYNYKTPLGYINQPGFRQPDSNSRLYDARNFHRVNSNVSGISDRSIPCSQVEKSEQTLGHVDNCDLDNRTENKVKTPCKPPEGQTISSNTGQIGQTVSSNPVPMSESAREGPMPQVPSLPKDVQQTGRGPSPSQELPWPHGPPPPYSPAENTFEV